MNGAVESGGFPPETVGAGAKNIDPCLPFETLPSPVIAEDMNDELDETLKLSFVNSSSVVLGFEFRILGLEKSRVMLCG